MWEAFLAVLQSGEQNLERAVVTFERKVFHFSELQNVRTKLFQDIDVISKILSDKSIFKQAFGDGTRLLSQ